MTSELSEEMQLRRGICERFEQHSRSSPEFDRSLQALHGATVDKSSHYDELMFYANPVPANNFPASLVSLPIEYKRIQENRK